MVGVDSSMSAVTESIEIQNVVGSTSIGQDLNLDALSDDLEGTEFNPERFPGLIHRIEDPEAAALIFNSGKIVCTGADSVSSVDGALEQTFQDLRGLGVSVQESPPIEIQNIVSSADLGRQLNLNAIAVGLGLEDVEYEPEQFPGLVYRIDDPDVVVLLFGSGKLIITGAQHETDAKKAITKIEERLTDLGLLD